MRNIWIIIKKEFARFFKDRRMLVALFLPGILIYVVYSFMGDIINSMVTVENNYVYTGYVVNQSNLFKSTLELEKIKINFEEIDESHIEEHKEEIKNREKDIIIVFPKQFDESLKYQNNQSVMNVEIFYNSTKTESSTFYQIGLEILNKIESKITNIFDINAGQNYDLADEKDLSASIISNLLPMLMLMLILSGCIGIAPESIAGEKERGTIATLLVTPLKRRELAIGKIVSISSLALISGLVSFIGVMLSFPKLIARNIDASIYGFKEYFLIFLVIISLTLMAITLMAIVSSFAKSVKEATNYISPFMILMVLLSLSTMITQSAANNVVLYLIPFFNVNQTLYSIFSFDINVTNLIVTVIANVVYTILGIFMLTKMFGNEKIMFSR